MSTQPADKSYLTNADEWSPFAAYQPLDTAAKEIRLLTLQGYNDEKVLQCSMQRATLTRDHLQYHALSYYWGAPVPKDELLSIQIDNSLMEVRPTTARFLDCLFGQTGPVTVWLDTICINQEDIQERNHQVSIMGDIYAAAARVYTWLGEATAETDYAFNALDDDDDNDVDVDVEYRPDDKLMTEFVEQILLRPYWTRVWVIQEFIMAQTVILICGNKTLPWARLNEYIQTIPRNTKDECWKRHQKFEQGRQYSSNTTAAVDDGLLALMERYQESRCVDPRDKVYALLGLSSEGALVPPDYSMPVADLFYRLVSLHPPMTSRPVCLQRKKQHSLLHGCSPLKAAYRIQKALSISNGDLLVHLQSKPNDRLYVILDLVGSIEGVVPPRPQANQLRPIEAIGTRAPEPVTISTRTFKVKRIDGKPDQTIPSTRVLCEGDLVYTAPKSQQLDRSMYLFYRPSTDQIIDLVVMGAKYGGTEQTQNILDACLPGIKICTASWEPRARRAGILLLHLSRRAHYIFWLQPKESNNAAVAARMDLGTADTEPECCCISLDDDEAATDCITVPAPEGFLACHTIIKVEEYLRPMTTGEEGVQEKLRDVFKTSLRTRRQLH